MKSIALLLLASAFTHGFAQNISAQDATTFALTYGYPLLAYEKIRIQVNATGVNKWLHFRDFQTPSNKFVVKPNVDTLYSSMVYDLSHDDLLVSIPEGIPDSQFHLISFFDPFGTNYVNLGSLNTNTPGTYRLQPRTTEPTPQISSGNDTVVATIKTSSIYGFLLIRWLVNNTNIDQVHDWQDRTINATEAALARAPALASLPVISSSRTPADNVLNLLTAFERYTLPDSTELAQNVTATLAIAGIGNGTYTSPNVNITQANQTAVATAASAAAAPSARTTLDNNWTVANSSLIGIYDDNYAFRTAVASGGYLAIRSPNAIYPGLSIGDSAALGGDFTLGPNDAIVLTFSGKPPLTDTGFWSLTAYQDNYLIANQYNTYAITSERSNFTYADGTRVYGTSLNQTFQVLIQPADIAPPSNWSNNFLPGPPGGGRMALTLRIYDAQQSLLDGQWSYPAVSKQAAIGNGTNASNTTTAPSSSPTSTTNATAGTATYTGDGLTWTVPGTLLSAAVLLTVVWYL
ncbi:hypothetical protein AMS68_008009 [Peltaster fructicola]|uniref:DUF1254 domain-containing protein n=1 Tax=Peltaster fructicola TaxID=286661 RepID=A0A6H0Y613_9PEZI|nr:hypothetical protein AMS68_008009 [Peltaster fructicola]